MDYSDDITRHYERYEDSRKVVELWTIRNKVYAMTFELMTFDATNEAEQHKPEGEPRFYSEPIGQLCWHHFCHEDEVAHRCSHSPTGFCHGDGSYMGGDLLKELAHGYRRDNLELRNERMFSHLYYRFEQSKDDYDPRG